jgi:hypothetical protein
MLFRRYHDTRCVTERVAQPVQLCLAEPVTLSNT